MADCWWSGTSSSVMRDVRVGTPCVYHYVAYCLIVYCLLSIVYRLPSYRHCSKYLCVVCLQRVFIIVHYIMTLTIKHYAAARHSTVSNPSRVPVQAQPSWFDAMLQHQSCSTRRRSLWWRQDWHHCGTRTQLPWTFLGCWGAVSEKPYAGLLVAICAMHQRGLAAQQGMRVWQVMPMS